MPKGADKQRFRNEDLVLKVSTSVDRAKWDESRYEAFIDELCKYREYQKEAIKTTLRYLLGGNYSSLQELAKENLNDNPVLEERFGSWDGMKRHLQLPDQLSASLDLATGTGKSYVLYGIAAILLSEGTIDRVLVLCPSTTIETGLTEKFSELASNIDLKDLLPGYAKIASPRVINASETITKGSICIENYHAILEHVGSSVRTSLKGIGSNVLILNDETHHVYNESATKTKRWKEFLTDPEYGFHNIIGVSGTCYMKNDYFSDVIFRYSLRQAMEERYVKLVNYIAEMPRTGDPEEKWQLIYNHHEETKKKLRKHSLCPLTIIVTGTISRCKDVTEELKHFLIEFASKEPEEAEEQILKVYNNAPDVLKLPFVDNDNNKVEWIVAVSMLNEGWDVKRVFHIVPHEERAFNSKLLIAQVLGRGLRIPLDWKGRQPEVIVFNHDAWASRIKNLVNEVLDIEKRLSAQVILDSPFHFDLQNIDYTLKPTSIKKPMKGKYTLLSKGFVDLATDAEIEEVSVEFERAMTGDHYKWQTKIRHKTYSTRQVAVEMYRRLEEAQDPDDPDPKMRTVYTDKFPLEKLEEIVKLSLDKAKISVITDRIKQKFLQALGTLRRKTSEYVRYSPLPNRFYKFSTENRQGNSVSAAELHRDKTYFYTEKTRASIMDEQLEFFDEVTEPGSGFKCVRIENFYDFKTPMNAVIADSDNERRFMLALLDKQNLIHYESWIKSTSTRFYEIDYSWKKGEHAKRSKFNPDFFIKSGNLIIVIEIKGDEELDNPSEENRKKYEWSIAHFKRINDHQEKVNSPDRYKFNFLSPTNFNIFFQCLREGNIIDFRSELDVKLSEKLNENQ